MSRTKRKSFVSEYTKVEWINKEIRIAFLLRERYKRFAKINFKFRDKILSDDELIETATKEALYTWDKFQRDSNLHNSKIKKYYKWDVRKSDRARNRSLKRKVMNMEDYDDEDFDWSRRKHGKMKIWSWF